MPDHFRNEGGCLLLCSSFLSSGARNIYSTEGYQPLDAVLKAKLELDKASLNFGEKEKKKKGSGQIYS